MVLILLLPFFFFLFLYSTREEIVLRTLPVAQLNLSFSFGVTVLQSTTRDLVWKANRLVGWRIDACHGQPSLGPKKTGR